MAMLVNGRTHGRADCNMIVVLTVCAMALQQMLFGLLRIEHQRQQHVALQIRCA